MKLLFKIRKVIYLLAILCIGYGVSYYQKNESLKQQVTTVSQQNLETEIANDSQAKDIKSLQGVGTVVTVLSDDTKGLRHQRFILQLTPGRTILVVHNIDQAPRLEGLKTGDKVGFMGEYIPNKHGGIVHWTHKDNSGHHVNGWLEYKGKRYQ